MINREIPFRPRLEGEFRVRFYNAASEITEKTPTLTIARIAEREIEWVEKDCQYNIEQRKKYRAVWFLFRDLIRASWKACYRNGVIYMSLPTLNGTDMHDTTSPEVKALLRSWMSESRHERLVGYTDFINRMENPGTNKQSIAALIADGDELEKRIKRVHTGEIAIEAAVQPYLQLVRENDRDVFTGLKTSEIWRYFRLTWSTPVETTPGRTMQYLIRDAAHPMHAVMLIKGGNASGMKYGDTLSDDAFTGYEFDYIISNPPFGIDWKREKTQVEAEAKKGFDGRFGPGLPAISDGQMLFMLNGVKKLKPGSGRMAIIQNGSSLFTGDAGSGASEIRRYVIEGDLVEAIIQLPTDLFYNTGISTYIWVLTKGKAMHRGGKVQLIDASKCFVKRRKNIGSKRVDLDDACIDLILRAYEGFVDETYEENGLAVESKVFDNSFFGFTKVTVETAQADAKGKPVLKKGKKQPVKGASDTEIIPLSEDRDTYMKKNVLPYNPLAYIDPAKDKIGYEVPFTRLFYKFTQPTPSAEIFEEIKALEDEETILMKELFGHA